MKVTVTDDNDNVIATWELSPDFYSEDHEVLEVLEKALDEFTY